MSFVIVVCSLELLRELPQEKELSLSGRWFLTAFYDWRERKPSIVTQQPYNPIRKFGLYISS